MATISDVAKAAGVSISTVSLVLNGSSRVKESTRLKIQQVIDQLDFKPNEHARSLISKKTNNLGLILLTENQWRHTYDFNYQVDLFGSNVTNGLLSVLKGSGYGLVTEHHWIGEKKNLPDILERRCVDGLFIVGSLEDKKLQKAILDQHVPCVRIAARTKKFDCVYIYYEQVAMLAVEYLVKRGHRRICMVNLPAHYPSSAFRCEGFKQAIAAHGLDPLLQLEVLAEHNTGQGALSSLLKLQEFNFDAIIGVNDVTSAGSMRYLLERGLKVPEDISLVCMEDSSLCSYSPKPITSFNVGLEEMGEMAAELMLKRLQHPQRKIASVAFSPTFAERATVIDRDA